MKKALRILLAMSIVGALFAVGFTGTAAAEKPWWKKQEQKSWQYAESDVDQDQWVNQQNFNEQKDNYAVSIGKGDATAVQASSQSNNNAQVAYSNAENTNDQDQKH